MPVIRARWFIPAGFFVCDVAKLNGRAAGFYARHTLCIGSPLMQGKRVGQ